jgi:hypothetical protein
MDAHRLAGELVIAPRPALSTIVARRSIAPALVIATAAAVVMAWVVAPRIDWTLTVQQRLSQMRDVTLQPEQVAAITRQFAAWGSVRMYLGAVVFPSVGALLAALSVWLAFRFAEAHASFREALAVIVWARLPLALGEILAIPALLKRTRLLPDAAASALPTCALFFAPEFSGAARIAVTSLDLFAIWSVGLAAIGMAIATRTSVRRSATIMIVLWGAWIALRMGAVAVLGTGS